MARGRRRPGSLTPEDRALWSHVARSVERRHREAKARDPDAVLPPNAEPAGAIPPRAEAQVMLPAPIPPDFRLGAAAAPAAPRVAMAQTPAERLAGQPLRMDSKAHRNLTRGKLRPEARIDLHGMTLAVAKVALTGFILSAQASGRRLVLVITGKGKGDHGPLPTRSGALRHEVPHWLAMPPVAASVAQVVPAHFRHGGGGAYYVWLRRSR